MDLPSLIYDIAEKAQIIKNQLKIMMQWFPTSKLVCVVLPLTIVAVNCEYHTLILITIEFFLV